MPHLPPLSRRYLSILVRRRARQYPAILLWEAREEERLLSPAYYVRIGRGARLGLWPFSIVPGLEPSALPVFLPCVMCVSAAGQTQMASHGSRFVPDFLCRVFHFTGQITG